MDNLNHSPSINLVDNLNHWSSINLMENLNHSPSINLDHSPSINFDHSSTISTQINFVENIYHSSYKQWYIAIAKKSNSDQKDNDKYDKWW